MSFAFSTVIPAAKAKMLIPITNNDQMMTGDISWSSGRVSSLMLSPLHKEDSYHLLDQIFGIMKINFN